MLPSILPFIKSAPRLVQMETSLEMGSASFFFLPKKKVSFLCLICPKDQQETCSNHIILAISMDPSTIKILFSFLTLMVNKIHDNNIKEYIWQKRMHVICD